MSRPAWRASSEQRKTRSKVALGGLFLVGILVPQAFGSAFPLSAKVKSLVACNCDARAFTLNRLAVASDILRSPALHPTKLLSGLANRHVRLCGAQSALTGYGAPA